MRDFVQRLIAERDTSGPLVTPRNDDITKKVKIDVVDISRDAGPKVFVDLLNSLEDYFAWYGINDEQQIAFTKVKLKGPARIWWYGVENNELALGQPITRWFNMKGRLKSNFLPSDYIDTLHQGYLTLQQGNLSVEEYTNKFREYIVRCNLKTDDRLTITRFRDGLRNDIRREVAMFDYTRVDEVFCKARKAQHEFQLRRRNTFQVGELATRRGPEPTFNRTQTQGYRRHPPKPFQ
eukprot:TRINITY_DN6228_c0_g1_i6.p1 TRINITY_DN6228_c0_g1~~TRINITY_DN6228_c0_g1_i6.p1  ORF type:complete len:236 (+),score=22.74 TRINITY_DN6228_c0_g1_i6:765-1472(+)